MKNHKKPKKRKNPKNAISVIFFYPPKVNCDFRPKNGQKKKSVFYKKSRENDFFLKMH